MGRGDSHRTACDARPGEFHPHADPDRLALAMLASLQGGLLLTQSRRDTTPLAAGLDVMIDYTASLVKSQ